MRLWVWVFCGTFVRDPVFETSQDLQTIQTFTHLRAKFALTQGFREGLSINISKSRNDGISIAIQLNWVPNFSPQSYIVINNLILTVTSCHLISSFKIMSWTIFNQPYLGNGDFIVLLIFTIVPKIAIPWYLS